jgi:hypothetical protein
MMALKYLKFACAGALLSSLIGCAESAVIAAAGVTAGFGLAQGQAEAFINGELKAARMVSHDLAWDAALSAFRELQLPVTYSRRDEFDSYVRGQAEGGPEIKVQLKAKSPLITKVEIRIGLMGDQAVSRLVLSRIDHQLGIAHPVVPVEQSPIVAPGTPATVRDTAPD